MSKNLALLQRGRRGGAGRRLAGAPRRRVRERLGDLARGGRRNGQPPAVDFGRAVRAQELRDVGVAVGDGVPQRRDAVVVLLVDVRARLEQARGDFRVARRAGGPYSNL